MVFEPRQFKDTSRHVPETVRSRIDEVPCRRPRYWREGFRRRIRGGVFIEKIVEVEGVLQIEGWGFGLSHFTLLDGFGLEITEGASPTVSWFARQDVLEQHKEFVASDELGFVMRIDLSAGAYFLALKSAPLEINPILVWSVDELRMTSTSLQLLDRNDLSLSFVRLNQGAVELLVESKTTLVGQFLEFDCSIESHSSVFLHLGKLRPSVRRTEDGEFVYLFISKAILLLSISHLESIDLKLRLRLSGAEVSFVIALNHIVEAAGQTLVEAAFVPKSTDEVLSAPLVSDLAIGDAVDLHLFDLNIVGTDLYEIQVHQVNDGEIRQLAVRKLGDGMLPPTIRVAGCDDDLPVLIIAFSPDGTLVGLDVVWAPWLYRQSMRNLLSVNHPAVSRNVRTLETGLSKKCLASLGSSSDLEANGRSVPRFFHVSMYAEETSLLQLGWSEDQTGCVTNKRFFSSQSDLASLIQNLDKASDYDFVVFTDGSAVSPDLELHIFDWLDVANDIGIKWSGVARDSRGFLFHVPPASSLEVAYSAVCRSFCVSMKLLRAHYGNGELQPQIPDADNLFQFLWPVYERARYIPYISEMHDFEAPTVVVPSIRSKRTPYQRIHAHPQRESFAEPWSIVISYRDAVAATKSSIMSIVENNFDVDLEFILVDNLSAARSADEIHDWFITKYPHLRMMCLGYHKRFNHSAQTNLGVRAASNQNVAVFSNDAIIQTPNCLTYLQSVLTIEKVATVGFLVEESKKSNFAIQDQVFTGTKGQLERSSYLGLSLDTSPRLVGLSQYSPLLKKFREYPSFALSGFVEVGGNSFGSVCMNKSRFLSSGGLNEIQFPTDYNDVEFCLRTLEMGYIHLASADVRVLHPKNGSRQSEFPATGPLSRSSHAVAASDLVRRTLHLL